MTTWTSQLTAVSGNYQPIIQSITPGDGEVLQTIYDYLILYLASLNPPIDLFSFILGGAQVNLQELNIDIANLATLQAIGLITTNDFVHITLTPLAYGFITQMNALPPIVEEEPPAEEPTAEEPPAEEPTAEEPPI